MPLQVSGTLNQSAVAGLASKIAGLKASISPGGLGPELVQNGNFADGTGWTLGTGWTIATGQASKASGATSDLSQATLVPTAAAKYRITYTLTFTAGSFMARIGNTAGTARTASGTYTEDLVAVNSIAFSIRGGSTSVGSVTGISVKQVLS